MYLVAKDGTASQKVSFHKGKADGKWQILFKSGKIKSISYNLDGEEVSEWVTYDDGIKNVKNLQY